MPTRAARLGLPMVVASGPVPGCSDDAVVPNVLHKVWSGHQCPPVQDLVSLLSAKLLLQPEQIIYWADGDWAAARFGTRERDPPRCLVRIRGRETSFGSRLSRCYSALRVRFERIRWEDSSAPLVNATRSFAVSAKLRRKEPGLQAPNRADIIRLFAINRHGGYYMDADAFALSSRLHQLRRCPYVLSSDVMDAPKQGYYTSTGRPPTGPVVKDSVAAVVRANNGVMLGAPNSTFGLAHWSYYSRNHFDGWDFASGQWPFLVQQPGSQHVPRDRTPLRLPATNMTHHILVATSLRTLGFSDDDPMREIVAQWGREEWGRFVTDVTGRDAHALHMSWFVKRLRMKQAYTPVVALLEHAVHSSRELSQDQQDCIDLAREWLEAVTEPGEKVAAPYQPHIDDATPPSAPAVQHNFSSRSLPAQPKLCVVQYEDRNRSVVNRTALFSGERNNDAFATAALMRLNRLRCEQAAACTYIRGPQDGKQSTPGWVGVSELMSSYPPWWAKVFFAQAALLSPRCRGATLIFLDADAVLNQSPEKLLPLLGTGAMAISGNPRSARYGWAPQRLGNFCAGAWLIHNSPVGRLILRDWIDSYPASRWSRHAKTGVWMCALPGGDTCPWAEEEYEQGAFLAYVLPKYRSSIRSVDPSQMNEPCISPATAGALTCHFAHRFKSKFLPKYLTTVEVRYRRIAASIGLL